MASFELRQPQGLRKFQSESKSANFNRHEDLRNSKQRDNQNVLDID